MIDRESPAGSWAAILQHCRNITVLDGNTPHRAFHTQASGAATSEAAFDPGAASRFSNVSSAVHGAIIPLI